MSENSWIPYHEDKKKDVSQWKNTPIGRITETIGRGEDAKNSLIYLTLKWSFITGVAISVLVMIDCWFFSGYEQETDVVGDLSTVWEILIPIITLALGYAFGKAQN